MVLTFKQLAWSHAAAVFGGVLAGNAMRDKDFKRGYDLGKRYGYDDGRRDGRIEMRLEHEENLKRFSETKEPHRPT